MDIVEPDKTPAQVWKASLDATCNRLMSHYHSLLRAAVPATAVNVAASSSSPDTDGGSPGGSSPNDGGIPTPGINRSVTSHEQVGTDPRAGGWLMRNADDPPPPLAAEVLMGSLQAKLAAENLCVAASNLLDIIRTLRLSVLLLDEELIRAEEEEEALDVLESSLEAEEECVALEAKLRELRSKDCR